MSLTTNPVSFAQRLNVALPGELADALRTMKFGDFVRTAKTFLYRKNPTASSYNVATANVIVLPDDAKASHIIRAYARATGNGGALGAQTIDADATAPADGHASITPNGDINVGTLALDITDVDVVYEPLKVDPVELTLSVVPGTGVCAIPARYTASPLGVVILMEAEALVGTVVEKKIVLAAAAGAPATHNARLDVAKANVQFAVADAVTSARVKLGLVPAVDIDALLEASSPII